MIGSIIGASIPVLLKLLGWFLDRSSVKKETMKTFWEFVERAGNDMGSTKLADHGKAQAKWLDDNPFVET